MQSHGEPGTREPGDQTERNRPLRELISATNPEVGSPITYTYDAAGNLATKTAPGVTTTYGYDAANRMTSKSYNDGITPGVTLSYDGVGSAGNCPGASAAYNLGRLTAVTTAALGANPFTAQALSYDPLGRTCASSETVGSAPPYGFQYSYNLASELTQEIYPSGRAVNTGWDTGGRIVSVGGVLGSTNTTYATIPAGGYWPHGAIHTLNLGNGLTETALYNIRLQMDSLTATDSNNVQYLALTYAYPPASTSTSGLPSGGNNGNLVSQTIHNDMVGPEAAFTVTQSYTSYDGVNRLTGFAENNHGQTYNYDAFGNRWLPASDAVYPASPLTPTAQSAYDATSNRLNVTTNCASGTGYDGRGNLQSVCPFAIGYDGENRQVTATATTLNVTAGYGYDGNGRRVQKVTGGVTTTYVYDAMGLLAAEYATPEPAATGTEYYTADHLGSTRLITDVSRNVKHRYDYLPFGEGLAAGVNGRSTLYAPYSAGAYPASGDGESVKFTGKEPDAETGLDFFESRYYSSAQGRFTSPDEFKGGFLDAFSGQPVFQPGPLPYADLTDPQTLNKYAYVRNNPLRYTDPSGHCLEDACILEGAAVYAAASATVAWLSSPQGQESTKAFIQGTGLLINKAAGAISSLFTKSDTQGRDAQGKFLPTQPGQAQPGADAEKGALAAEGATKTGTTMPGTDRKVDGTVTATGQKIEVKSGETVANTDQLRQTGQAAVTTTGMPLLVVTTNPNVKVTAPAQNNPNLQIRPVKRPDEQ